MVSEALTGSRSPAPWVTEPVTNNKRRHMYYRGGFVFAAMAILLVMVGVRKFRQSND
jgi:hypothetical protein